MSDTRSVRCWLVAGMLLLGTACLLPQLRAARPDFAPGLIATQLRQDAERLEKDRQWSEAGKCWSRLLSVSRDQPDVKEHLQICQRRAQQVRRLGDATYQDQVRLLTLQETLQIYNEVINLLHGEYVDRDKVDFAALFKHGLEELRVALSDPTFCQERLPRHLTRAAIQDFQARLEAGWQEKPIRNAADVLSQAKAVALAAQKELHLRPTLVVLELICGACSGLDDYTAYLTPAQFTELDTAWKGAVVGVGIELTVVDKKLTIAQVLPGSPAEANGLKANDQIKRIGNKQTADLAVESASELLKGEVDTTIEVEVANGKGSRVLKLKRQLIQVATVSAHRFLDEELRIGYLQVTGFQETTVQELDLAIAKLQKEGMKVLILDLRGNEGGLVDVAVQFVERFLSNGLIVSTQGQVREYNTRLEAHSPNALTVPVVLVVDGETASAAEIVAVALKDHQRGKLVGQTTFGKGCIQKVRKLTTVPSGIRMTVAKFYSPRGQAISGAGVTPHVLVERPDMPMDVEQDTLQTALDIARQMLMGQ